MAEVKSSVTWLEASKQKFHALFSEMDVLLRALDRFFIIENLPASKIQIHNKNLYPELNAARDAVLRVLAILEIIIPESNRNAYWFQKYAENRLLDTWKRDIVKGGMYKQETPEQSLYLLYDSFINMKNLVTDILKNRDIHFVSFENIGQLISKEIRGNLHFNPFKQDITLELDFITNREIKDVVRRVPDKETKKAVSILFLHLFRFLRYIRHMDHKSQRFNAMNCSILIFSLIRSEIEQFRTYITKTASKLDDQELVSLLQALSYQFGMESKRVFQQEMKDIFEKKTTIQLRGKIENSRGILKNLTEQSIIQMAKHWATSIKGERIFEIYVTKAAQSVRLREDMYVLHRILAEIERWAEKPEERAKLIKTLLNYMNYFESFTFKLIRYDDFEEFSLLFNNLRKEYEKGESNMKKILESCHGFDIFITTTLRQIDNRADLKDRPLDVEKVEEVVDQYIGNIIPQPEEFF